MPIILACAFEFPQTMNISVKSNDFGLHAILNNVRRNTQEFSMTLIFACAFFYWFAGPPVWTNPRIRKMRKRFIAEPAGNTVQFKCLPNGAPPLTMLWFKNNKLIEKDQQVGGYRGYSSVTTTEWFLSEILNLIGEYKRNAALWIDRCFILIHKVHTFHSTACSSVHRLHTWLLCIHPGSWNVVYL